MNKKRSDYLSWEDYFMAVAFLSAQRSKDPRTQVWIDCEFSCTYKDKIYKKHVRQFLYPAPIFIYPRNA